MRISTRLLLNALTTYGRLAVTFLIGIFFVWYVIDQVGLVGFGAVALGGGSFGIAATLNYTIRQSVVRELSAALATGAPARVETTLVSMLAFTALAAGLVVLIVGALVALALRGAFNTDAVPGMERALAALFAAEGLITVTELLLAPYTLAFFASQRVGADNFVIAIKRLISPLAAVLAFGVLSPDGDLPDRLLVFAALRGGLGVLEIVITSAVARLLVPRLRLRVRAFERGAFRAVAATSWHTAQFTLAADLNPHLMMLLINLFFGLTFNGMWQIVIQVGGHARMLGRAGLHGIDPMAAHLQEQGRRDTILHLMHRALRYQLIVVLPFVCVYAIYLAPILTLWVGGRLQEDERLAAAGITAAEAIAMISVMGAINLLAELLRISTFGMERILYGLGLVGRYAWFAKWSVVLAMSSAAALMWAFATPVVAAIPLAAVNLVYFCVIIPRAAARYAELPVARVVRPALPKPLLMTALLVAAVVPTRLLMPELTLPRLLGLAVGIGIAYAPLLLLVGLDAEERARLRELLRGRLGRV